MLESTLLMLHCCIITAKQKDNKTSEPYVCTPVRAHEQECIRQSGAVGTIPMLQIIRTCSNQHYFCYKSLYYEYSRHTWPQLLVPIVAFNRHAQINTVWNNTYLTKNYDMRKSTPLMLQINILRV